MVESVTIHIRQTWGNHVRTIPSMVGSAKGQRLPWKLGTTCRERERERGNNERNAGISGAITKTLRSVNGLFGTGDTHNH